MNDASVKTRPFLTAVWKRLKRVLILSGITYLGVLVLLTLLETFLMYPAPSRDSGDWEATWLKHEDVYVTTAAGNEIHGWYCEHPDPKRVLLLCHGNGEHVAYMAEELEFFRDEFEASVFAFDYRGYGKSKGKPFETGILADGEAAQDWLAERAGVAQKDVVLWGRSLGGAVAVHLAAKNGAKALVLDRTFNSMVDVAATHYPYLPVKLLLRNRYPSDVRIANYDGPLIQVHGHPDQVVPFACGQLLFEQAASQNKKFLDSPELGHNTPWPAQFYVQVLEFLTRVED